MGTTTCSNSAKQTSVKAITALAVFIATLFVVLCLAPGKAFAAKSVHLKDGETFDLSQVKTATRVYIDTAGDFTLTGSSSKVLVDIQIPEGDYASVMLDGVTLTPNGSAPGASYNDRSAITIKDTKNGGGEVELMSAANTTSTITGYKNKPAIQKSGTKTKLRFTTENLTQPGTIVARADSSAFRTCAIGAYGSVAKKVMNTAGNIEFWAGNIEAYGSPGGGTGGSGGAGIGADAGAFVDGITIHGGNITAVAGDGSAAAIGTSSADVTYLVLPWLVTPIAPRDAKNIAIEGGTVVAKHADGKGGSGGAGIGGGYGCSADGITISGGKVLAEGSTGIGGGSNGDGLNIKITGGDIEARGQFTGIGGGKSTGTVTDNAATWFGEATVDISGGKVYAYCTGTAGAGVGIGGWKSRVIHAENLNGRGHVSISGGEVTAVGACGLAGIGTGECGSLDYISISGGFVYAEGGSGGASPAPGIGMPQGTQASYSHIKRISISGGTVEAIAANDADYSIGAFSSISAFGQKTAAPVYISGGNIMAPHGINVTPKQSAGGKDVVRYQVNTETYNYESDLTDSVVSNLVVRDLSNDSSETIPYGYNDMHPFKAPNATAATYYLWLPLGEKSVEVRLTPHSSRLPNRDADFSGIATATSEGLLLYPRTRVTLVADSAGTGQGIDGSIVLAQGLGSIDYQRAVCDGKELVGYSLSADGAAVLDAQGKLIVDAVDLSGKKLADSAGRFVGSNAERYNKFILYAQWKDTDGVVQFDPNKPAGVASPVAGDAASKSLGVGEQVQLNNELTLAGYSFAGWNTKPDGSGEAYGVGDFVSIKALGEVVTLYAQWQRSDYQICFMPNDGELESGEASYGQRAFFGVDALLDDPEMTLQSRHLSGWNTDPDGTGDAYDANESVLDIAETGQEVVYLYAQWDADTYTVMYDGNGAEGEMNPDRLECGIAHLLPNRGFEREGFVFTGWNTLPDGSGEGFAPEGAYADLAGVDESVTLYAQWAESEPEPSPDPDPAPAPTPEPSGDAGGSAGQPQTGVSAQHALAGTGDSAMNMQVALAAVALTSALAIAFLLWRMRCANRRGK